MVWNPQALLGALVGLTLMGAATTARAQSAADCTEWIATAEEQYVNGAFGQTIHLVSECLNEPSIDANDAVAAYRMLALAHIKQNELRPAREAIVNMLGADPTYEADRINDPPVFVSMVSLVRREMQLGPNALPVQPVYTLSPQPAEAVATARLQAVPAAPSADPGAPSRSFFRRANTWLTIGGVMIGSGAKSGNHATGLGVGVVGVGAGGTFTGIGVGGLVVGGGNALNGIMVGGLGVGSGDQVNGLALGGVGVGTGGQLNGLALGGLGIGSGKAIRGLALGGLGVGTGGNLSGSAFALLGVGGKGSVTGFTAAGLGVGAGGHLRGLHLAGVGVVSERMSGVVASSIVASGTATGGVVAPLYFRITGDGQFTGLSISLFNHVQGTQRGVTIGLFNMARSLHGVQLGALNYAGNNPLLLRVLPLINAHF